MNAGKDTCSRGFCFDVDFDKMNVNIAAQTLSVPVARATNILQDKINHPAFEGSEATTAFIKKG